MRPDGGTRGGRFSFYDVWGLETQRGLVRVETYWEPRFIVTVGVVGTASVSHEGPHVFSEESRGKSLQSRM